MAHYYCTGKQADDSRQACHLTNKVGQVAVEQNQTCFLDWESQEGLVHLQQITDPKTKKETQGNAEKEKITEIKDHCHEGAESRIFSVIT